MVEFTDVSIHFGTQDVLQHASFRVNKGERCGLVGPNGAGKSTVFHLITGETSPESGTVTLEGKPRIGHLHQQLQPHSEHDSLLAYAMRAMPRLEELEQAILDLEARLADETNETERERILRQLGVCQTEFEHLGGYEVETRVKSALCGLGFRERDFRRPFTEFSGGWQMRAELVRTLVMQPELLLLDEPSNYLDLPAVEWIQRFLREYQGTLLLISHDRYLLRSITTVTLEVDGRTITRYNGGLDFYLREREQRYATVLAAKRNQDRVRDQVQRFIDTFRYTASKAAQVQSRVKQLEKLEEIVVPRQASSAGHLRLPPPDHCGACTLRLQNVCFSYDGETFVFRGVSFEVGRGDRIALVGYNGMGKTTLSRVLAGIRAPTEGEIVFGHKVVPGYVSQEFSEIIPPDQTLIRAVRCVDERLGENAARSLLGSFGFSGDDAFKASGVLSGGEKIRLAFARLYACHPNVLILDEPTTHLDLNGRRALEDSLKVYPGTMVVVSHDVEFVRAVATKIIAIDPDGVHTFVGNYDDYRTFIARRDASGASAAEAPANAAEAGETKSRKDLRKERAAERTKRNPRIADLKRRIAAAETRITALEKEQTSLGEILGTPPANLDFAETNRRLSAIQTELATVNALWEQSAAELEILEAE
jgi:ATP-binding cassette subfamily F protein 3